MAGKDKKSEKYYPLSKFRIQRFPGQTLLFRCFMSIAIMMLIAGGLFGFVITFLAQKIASWVTFPHWLQVAYPWILIVVVYGPLIYYYRRWRRDLNNFTLGWKGEQAVAGELESLRPAGYRAFHSLNMGKYDIDHVLIGPAGVFAVETKTYSKRGGETIHFDGKEIRFPHGYPQTETINQANKNAVALRTLILREAKINVWVTALITYPGWRINSTIRQNPESLMVLNPRTIGVALQNQPAKLDQSTIDLLVKTLEEHQGEVYEGWE